MRRRLLAAIAGVAAAAVILFALPLAVALQRSFRDRELLRLQRDTVAATKTIDLGPRGTDPIELPATGDQLAVYDRGGRRVVGEGPGRADALVRSALRSGRPAADAGGDRLLATAPLVAGETVTGVLRISRADTRAWDSTRNAWLLLAALVIGLVAAATGAAVLLARRLARPLEAVGAAAARLGSGDFRVRAAPAGVAEVDAVALALNTTAARLDELLSRERAFSADASHQLRTPLAAVRIELEGLALRGHDEPELQAALAQIDRLEATIDTLLSVARDAPRHAGATPVSSIVDDARQRWHGVFAKQGRPLRAVDQSGGARTPAAPRVVAEILDVLIDNADQHGQGPVGLRARSLDNWIVLDVSDEGAGFADGDPERIFHRRDTSGEGHGIGLALARSLANAEGGRLSVTRTGPDPVLTLVLPAADK